MPELVGRRLAAKDGKLPYGGVFDERWLPGDYCGPIVGYTGDKPAVFYRLPGGCTQHLHHVCGPPHNFRECADGSLEIRNSILHKASERCDQGEWHGFLNEGHRWAS